MDEWVIQAGDIIALKVDEGLEQSRLLLLCISPAALASGWVALERSTAVHRDPSNAGRRFIPLLLGDCALPDTLRRYKYVDYREESEAAFAEVPATCRAEAEEVSLTPRSEPPSIGSSFEPFFSVGPGDNADWALVFRILNSGQHALTIRRAVYFLDAAGRVPILPDAKHSQVHREGYEVKFGNQWRMLSCRLGPGEEAISYVPLRNKISSFELAQGWRGDLLLEYEMDGRVSHHRAVL